jgi:hypothetical protein
MSSLRFLKTKKRVKKPVKVFCIAASYSAIFVLSNLKNVFIHFEIEDKQEKQKCKKSISEKQFKSC